MPWATLALILANLLPAFVLLFDPIWIDRFGFWAGTPSVGTAFTSLFLHQNVLHLLGNMLFLAAAGPAVEFGVGWFRYLLVYLIGGLAGCGAHWVLMRALEAPPLIGASGAVAACLGYACIRYFHTRVPLTPRLTVPVFTVALVWLGLQVLGAFVRLGDPEGTVSFWAHMGGFAAGLLLSVVFRAPHAADQEASAQSIQAIAHRSPAAALATAERHVHQYPEDLAAHRAVIEAARQLGDGGAEAHAIRRLIDRSTSVPEPEDLERLGKLGKLPEYSSFQRSKWAQQLMVSHPDVSDLLLMSIVSGPGTDAAVPDAMLSLATLRLDHNPAGGQKLLQELKEKYPLHPATELARTKGLLP